MSKSSEDLDQGRLDVKRPGLPGDHSIGGGIMTRICHRTGVASVEVGRVTGFLSSTSCDELSVEEPLEIRVSGHGSGTASTPVAVTMRTPGDDVDLAAGFLFTEGIISGAGDLEEVSRAGPNAVEARLRAGVAVDAAKLDRHSFVSSSCGACGKRSIAAVRVASRYPIAPGEPRLAPEVIHGLPRALRAGQSGFARTGGIHASGLFDANGRLLALREDVGRHNALDKLIGSELLAGAHATGERDRAGQRPGELRAGAKGGDSRSADARGCRGAVEPGGRPGPRMRDDAARLRPRREIQRLLRLRSDRFDGFLTHSA